MSASREIETQVVARDGRVVLLFSHRGDNGLVPAATDNLDLDPPAALHAAELLTAMAFEADTALKPVGETLKASLVQKHREKLVPRVALMLGSLRENKLKTDGQIAQAIIDQVCADIFS